MWQSLNQLLKAVFLVIILTALFLLVAVPLYIKFYSATKIVPAEKIPNDFEHAIIFGAGISGNNLPTTLLRDRLDTGIDLLRAGKVRYLVISGDTRDKSHNETEVMRLYLTGKGVLEKQLLIDNDGNTTYHTCLNAIKRGLRRAVLVTQKFHLNRALYLCNHLGLDAIGVSSDISEYAEIDKFTQRDHFAGVKAWLIINVPNLEPYLLTFP